MPIPETDSLFTSPKRLIDQVMEIEPAEGGSQVSAVTSQDDSQNTIITNPIEVPSGKIKVHSLEGGYLMDADKWPTLTEPERSHDGTNQVAVVEGPSQSTEGLDKEEGEQVWQSSAPRHKGKKAKQPAVATRTSSRIPRSGEPIIEKAAKRMQEKDDLLRGNKKSNPFTILNDIPNPTSKILSRI